MSPSKASDIWVERFSTKQNQPFALRFVLSGNQDAQAECVLKLAGETCANLYSFTTVVGP